MLILLKKPIPQAITEILVIDEQSPSGLKYIKSGKSAGTKLKSGNWQICYKKGGYMAHRIIWFLHTGEDPLEQEIDHIDRNPSNNKINNLRLATRSQNCINKTTLLLKGERLIIKTAG